MWRYIIIIVLVFSSGMVQAQSDSLFIPARTVPGKIIDFDVDNLGNMYILYENGQLKKLNDRGDSIAVFNDIRRYGKLDAVDVSNPLKVLLYFKDFGTILILDRFLNPRSTIDLRREGLFQVKVIAQSYDNNIWVFDELESKLKRIRDDGTLIDQFTDFRMIFDSMPSPVKIIDQDRQVFLYDPSMGIYIFDYYGSLRTRIPFLHWDEITVAGKTIFGRKGRTLYKYEPGTFKLEEFKLPEQFDSSRKVVITQGNIYRLGQDAISIFSYK